MAFSGICRICLSVNVRMFVLKKTDLQNLYKTLTNRFMDEDEGPIIVCFICHARLIRCRRLQQQAIEANAVLEQLLAGGSMSITKPHDEIQFTPICHIDIRPEECDIENDCKDEIFSLDSFKVEADNFENENCKFEEHGNHETELSEKNIKSNSTDSDINLVRKENLNFEGPTSNSKVKRDNQPINKKGKHPANIMKKKNLKQKHVAKQVYCCNNCDYICTDKRNFQRHMIKHTGEKPFSCNNCDYKCITKYELQKHMKTHTGEKPFSCNICEYRCIKKANLKDHIKIHTGEKPFSCNICVYKCITNSILQRHMKMHTGEKPFSCHICEYRFIEKSKLQKHMKIHTGEKPYSCHICQYRCITKSDLQRHMKIHTGEKPHSCHICEYRCITKSDLQMHIKTHTGEKPLSCHICEYKCIKKSCLQSHIKIHTGEKPFSCNNCDYKCITKYGLQKHMKKIHPR